MKRMKNTRIVFDIVLLLLFGALCNTRITGIEFHESAGILYAGLIAVHLVINRKWLIVAFKGKLRGKRAITLATVNIGLFVVFAVITVTGIRASQDMFPSTVKAPDYFLAIHAICGVIAAILVLTHVLLHSKAITKKKFPRKLAFAMVLTIVIGYSFVGAVQGTIKWTADKDSGPDFEQHDSTNSKDVHKAKDGESK